MVLATCDVRVSMRDVTLVIRDVTLVSCDVTLVRLASWMSRRDVTWFVATLQGQLELMSLTSLIKPFKVID